MASKRHGAACGDVRLGCWQVSIQTSQHHRPGRLAKSTRTCSALLSGASGLELICLQMVWTGGITPLGRGVRRRRKVGYRHFGPVGVVRYLPRSGARS
jgi:hypothetical protein